MSFNDKSDLFFYDYNIASLFVQENYLNVKPACSDSQVLRRVAKAADSLSLGDNVEKKIRSNMAWSLLPTQAVFSSVLPGEFMKGSFKIPPAFPSWLGKNSKAQKRKRLAQELHEHTRIVTSGSRMAIRLDYSQFLINAIIKPLVERGLEGVPDSLNIIKSYHLLREDIESLLEITSWGSGKSPWEKVDSKVKAALTRAYNKEVQPYSYSIQAGIKKKKVSYESEQGYGGDEEEDNGAESEEEDSIENSSMIKVKKTAASKNSNPKASTSKATGKTTTNASKSKVKK
jgi:replication factor C subunit 1